MAQLNFHGRMQEHQKAGMPTHADTPGVDPLTTQERTPNVTPTGAIDYPNGGDIRR